MTRIRLSIDRIVSDGPGIDRHTLERALRAELARMVATDALPGPAASRSQPVVRAVLQPTAAPLPARIATATLGAAIGKAVKP